MMATVGRLLSADEAIWAVTFFTIFTSEKEEKLFKNQHDKQLLYINIIDSVHTQTNINMTPVPSAKAKAVGILQFALHL